ncbi:type IV secretion system DNA-binding domain-containing protein [Aeoliella mucimassa]|uniref:type IV secretion system DNA-binding domain-containing protein n=1 Tax=Aeoliella mucimassa TaxID=2527972 RepID=UPI0018D43D39|nr:type IV secretion system DNA-binding domain-containing protein [Aeoliella mucimassa]
MLYKLSNEHGKPYDYGDTEFWESLGVFSEPAQAFAEGFPNYWRDVAGWYSKKTRELAAAQRQKNFFKLAHTRICPCAVTNSLVLPFLKNKRPRFRFERSATDHTNPQRNPFAFAYQGGAEPSMELWNALADCITESLQDADIPKTPLPHGYKQRERLPNGDVFCSGSRLAQQEILEFSSEASPDDGIRWGPLRYRLSDARKSHFLVTGTTRSGKTTILRLFLQSMFLNPAVRTVVYDFKGDLLPLLHPSSKRKTATHFYYLLNAYDSRGVAWDIAKDVDAESASTLAGILIPGDGHARRDYFLQTSRQLLTAVIRTLIECAGDRWTFLDLMLSIKRENIRSVLCSTDEGRGQYLTHIQGDGQTQQNVLSDLDACSQRYLNVATAWSRASARLSLSHWVNHQSKGLVIGNSLRNHADLQPINQAILYFLFHELLDNARTRKHHTFMILDEFARLGRLPVIEHALETAPGLGLSIALGIHDIATLSDIYGKSANGILGACGFRAYLRVKSAETARWMSDQIGAQDVLVELTSTSESRSKSPAIEQDAPSSHSVGTSKTKSFQRLTRPAVPAEVFMQLPLASADREVPQYESGVFGYFDVPMHPPYRGHLPRDVYYGNTQFHSPKQLDERLWSATEICYKVAGQTFRFSEKDVYPTPKGRFRPPRDLFGSLQALGFQFDGDDHTRPLPPKATSTPPAPAAAPQPESPVSLRGGEAATPLRPRPAKPNEPETPEHQGREKKHDLSKMLWDDEEETFYLPDQDDEGDEN